MTFFYDAETDTLVGNNMFYESTNHRQIASVDFQTLEIDVTVIMEDGRGLGKLREMRNAIDAAIDAHTEEE